MTDRMREEFETWFDSKHKTENESLNFAIREAMFDAWQASRAALCVEIPTEGEASSFGNYVVFDSDDVRAMLDAAGVRYK